jgi:hypothetical protein
MICDELILNPIWRARALARAGSRAAGALARAIVCVRLVLRRGLYSCVGV